MYGEESEETKRVLLRRQAVPRSVLPYFGPHITYRMGIILVSDRIRAGGFWQVLDRSR